MHRLKHGVIGFTVAASLVVAGMPATASSTVPDGTSTTATAAGGFHPGQRCNKKKMKRYHKKGFHCNKRGRLERL